tara:strand:+ start:18681 stop:19241 length:561 start_codon:yes stop_codon:yes gene_type:complete
MKKLFTFLKKINTNSLVAGSAVFISACALFLSLQEIRIMRDQQKATMYPYLTIDMRYNENGFGIILKNSGNGLAKITSYKVFNDSIHFREWLDVLQTYMPEAKNINYGSINTEGNIRNQMIPPGESKSLIFIKWTDETRELEKRMQDIKVSVSYSSLLNEHWIVEDGIPKQIEEPFSFLIEEEFGF